MEWLTLIKFAVKHRRAIVVVLATLAMAVLIWLSGAAHVQAKWDKEKQDQALAAEKQGRLRAEASTTVVTKYVDRVQVVQGKTKTIIKEVPVYVPADADVDCSIHMGFVRLHDAAAAGEVPGAARDPDAAAAGVALSAVAETVAENYGLYHECVEQVKGWQQWALAMGAGP